MMMIMMKIIKRRRRRGRRSRRREGEKMKYDVLRVVCCTSLFVYTCAWRVGTKTICMELPKYADVRPSPHMACSVIRTL
jgi:hypothetical protein